MKKFLTALIAAACLALVGVAEAKQPSSQPHGKPDKGEQQHGKPGLRSGLIRLDKHVYYPGDTINVRVTIPSSLTGYWSGEADAYVLVFAPDGSLISVPVSAPVPDSQQGLATVETTDLPAGAYQLAFVLVEKDGDPLLISDWYHGFSGLISTQRAFISESSTSEEDTDGDGEVDGDTDDDGYDDSEDEEPAPTNP